MVKQPKPEKNKGEETALDYGLTLLEKRDYSIRELGEKLRGKGFDESETQKSVSRLSEWGYLDDHKLSRRIIERFLEEERSREYIRRRLEKAGIEEGTLQVELDLLYPAEKEREIVLKQWESLRQNSGSNHPTSKEKTKWANKLCRRGFPLTLLEALLSSEEF